MTQFSKEGGGSVFPQQNKTCADLDQLTVDSGGVNKGRSVAVAVCCWLFALQRHFNGTSMALPWHFQGTSIANKNESLFVSVSVKRFSVFHMRDLYPHFGQSFIFLALGMPVVQRTWRMIMI